MVNRREAVQVPGQPAAVIEVVCQGGAREMGQAQGRAMRDRIRAARAALGELEMFRLQQPRWLPYQAYRWLAEHTARRIVGTPLGRDEPELFQRLEGIAEGAGVSLRAICLFNFLETLMASIDRCVACPLACSAVAVRGSRSATGEPLVAHNFDYLPIVQPYYLLRESRPAGRKRAIEFTTAPLAGAVDGINDRGLCITYNYAFATDVPPAPAASLSMAITDALATCSTVIEATERIRSRRRWGSGLLMLADATGDVASLEISSTRSYLRRPEAGEDIIFHTNSYFSDPMREVQIAQDAVYTQQAPLALRGRRIHQSSEMRNQRFQQLLGGCGVLNTDDLAAIMADHGLSGEPGDFTPCVHGSYWRTTACLQLYPASRRVRIAYDTACGAQYQEIQL